MKLPCSSFTITHNATLTDEGRHAAADVTHTFMMFELHQSTSMWVSVCVLYVEGAGFIVIDLPH